MTARRCANVLAGGAWFRLCHGGEANRQRGFGLWLVLIGFVSYRHTQSGLCDVQHVP